MRKYQALLMGLLASLLYISHANAAIYDVTLFPDLLVIRPNTTVFTFDNALAPGGDGTLTATAIGDLNGEGENVEVFAETAGGTSLGTLFDMAGCSEYTAPCTDTILISQTRLEQFTVDKLISLAFVIDPNNGAASVRYNSINLTYPLKAPGCSGLAPGQGGTVPPGQLDPPGCSGYAPGHQNGPPVSAVPLPATLPLLLSALLGLWGIGRWRRS